MKTIRKDWPKVRQYTKGENTYFRVDLRRSGYVGVKTRNFTNREVALKFAGDIGSKVNQNGLQSISILNQDPRLEAWKNQLAMYGKTLEEAFEFAIRNYQKEFQDRESPFMTELLTLWVDDKTTDKLKPLRPRSTKTIRNMANTFKADFVDLRIRQLNTEKLETYLSDKDISNQSRKNLRSYLGQFFNYCIKRGHITSNPVESISIHVQKETPKFFTVEQSQKIMELATTNEMIGYFSICLMAGVRPEETEKLTWDNIKMDTKEIFIPASISKTKKNRQFAMENNLHLWLSKLNQKLPLIPSGWRKAKRKIIKETGFWTVDGLRHSFATYHYAKYKNLETLRYVMGNSPNVIERFYKGVIAQADVEKFWSL